MFNRAQDLSDAEPTYTHMCIPTLYIEGHVSIFTHILIYRGLCMYFDSHVHMYTP